MQISGLQKLSLIDYPDKMACTVFLAGCNFRCPWCYNPELVFPEMIKNGNKISEQEFLDFLKTKKGMLDGVVLCGGEPTINAELVDFCRKIKMLGYAIKLDTNGSNPKMLKRLIDEHLVDYIALDVKATKEKYIRVIGVEKQHNFQDLRLKFWDKNIIRNIEESIKVLRQGKVDYEFRTTVVPGFLDKKDIVEIARWISPPPSIGHGRVEKYFLQGFRAGKTLDPSFSKLKPYSKEKMMEILKAIEPFFAICRLRI